MNQRFIRRNRVDERVALAIAAGSGIAAAMAGARPTGSAILDVLIVALAAAAVVWASASAQWWALAGAAGVSAVIAFHPIAAALGAIAFLEGLNIGTWRRDQTAPRALVGGVTVNLLIRSQLEGFFGLSALVGISVAIALLVLGLLRRPSPIRRVAWRAFAALGGLTTVALLAALVAAVSARPDVSSGASTARRAISMLNDGEYERAADLFDEAAMRFEQADSHLGGALVLPARLVPVAAQNIRSGAELSSEAATAAAEAALALRRIDPDSLRMRNGRIDLEAVSAVEAPLQRVNVALSGLRDVVDDVETSWLLGAVQAELRQLNEDFDKNEPRLQNAVDAVRLAPQLLGEKEMRRYLMLFTSPAEARGLGGFVGSFAVLEVSDGSLRVVEFGRTAALSNPTAGTDCSACPAELLDKYGRFGFTTGQIGTVGKVLYSNITMPAHFPNIAESISLLYPQATGESLDGVIVADPYAVQALMQYSGPVEVPELDTIVQPDEAAEFILSDQYIVAENKGVRIEALESLASGAISAVLGGDLPDPPTIARDLGPLIAERRLLMWTTDPNEQALFDRVGLLGSIPALDPVDGGFSVSVSNASGNKIEVFLDREVNVRVESTPQGRQLVADVVLTNNAPTTGLPPYVIGNLIGLPDGSSRLFVTFYGPATLVSATADGENFTAGPFPEGGWTAYSNFFEFAPGQSRSFRLVFTLPPTSDRSGPDADPTVWSQPLAARE